MENTLKSGDYVIVQRQNYTKLHKLKEHGSVTLGSSIVELDNVLGCRYYDTFQMIQKPGTKRFYMVEKVDEISTISQINVSQSGKDNRNITSSNESQSLTREDILKLRDEDRSSNDIVGQLITNSSTFASKTEYSQEKYMKKKVKKYFEYIQIRKPTIRLLMQMFYRQDPAKTLGMGIDDLSQIITYSNIQSEGCYLLFDSGSSGLIPAALLNAIGADTRATLIHTHPGNECQKNALVAMQFPREQLERCINVNVYSVLRCFYQKQGDYSELGEQTSSTNVDDEAVIEAEVAEGANRTGRKRKLDEDVAPEHSAKKPCWQLENEKACKILEKKVDAMIIVSKNHPGELVKELLPFLKGGRSLVVFNALREPLMDLYEYLKGGVHCISIRLINNFMRNYQVLPDRTHPEVNMHFGGYILTAYKLQQ